MAITGRGGSPFVSSYMRMRRLHMRTYPLIQQINWGDTDTAEASMFSDWFWPVTTASAGDMKVWNGSAWAAKPVKVWNGSAWVIKPAKVWNGSAWVETTY